MARYQKTANYPIGTVSSGTMRPEDLIPDFTSELSYRAKQNGVPVKQRKAHLSLVKAIETRMEAEDYFETEDADWDMESLFDALDNYAGPYFYFGAHPGDGSDYGFWLSEGFDDDFDGLKVDDLSEVPAKYRGEVMVVSDHGNVSLYVKTSRAMREVWAIV
jgi:hypothetical protein